MCAPKSRLVIWRATWQRGPIGPRRVRWRYAPSNVQVHPNRLRFGEIVDRRGAVLPAEAGIPLAAPRQSHIGIAIGVDPHRASPCPLRETLHTTHVAAPHPGSEAIGGAVGDAQCIGLVLELDHADDGTKDLLLRNTHLMLDIGEYGGADEVAAIADALAAGHQQR